MIVFAADLHLRPTTWTKFPELRGDAFYSFRQMIDFCCVEKADALILGGDVFDSSTPDSESVAVFQLGMSILEAQNIPVYGIQGQHERSEPPWMSLVSYVQHLDSPDLKIRKWMVPCDGGAVGVAGIDNVSATQLKAKLDADIAAGEHYDILVLHQALAGMVYESAWNLADEWLPSFVHIVLLGDLHIAANKGKCYYSGSLSLQNVSESPQKSFITVHRGSDGKLEVRRQPLEARDMIKLAITDETSRDASIDILKAYTPNKRNSEVARPLIVAYISTDVPSAYEYISAVCAEKRMFLDVRNVHNVAGDGDTQTTQVVEHVSMANLVGECVDPLKFDEQDKDELVDFAVRLLDAKDPAGELVAIKHDMGVTTETG